MLHTLAILAVGLATVAAGGGGTQAKGPAELEGTWKVTAMERDGKKAKLAEGKGKGAVFTIKGRRYALTIGDRVAEEGTFKVDASKRPRAVVFTVTAGEDKGKTFHGVYEVKGDTLRAVVAPADKERPTDFTGGPGSRSLTARRQKAD
jgi:uncharacterized protein (TIGR03067 family)